MLKILMFIRMLFTLISMVIDINYSLITAIIAITINIKGYE
jgi:hypothetical protein